MPQTMSICPRETVEFEPPIEIDSDDVANDDDEADNRETESQPGPTLKCKGL